MKKAAEQDFEKIHQNKISTHDHMIFNPPLNVVKLMAEMESKSFGTDDEKSEFLIKKSWESAI